MILSFIKLFLHVLAKILSLPKLDTFIGYLPGTIYSARKLVPNNSLAVRQFACCPRCSTIYDVHSLKSQPTASSSSSLSRHCTFIRFPNHPQRQHRVICGTELTRNARLSSGEVKLYPRLIYCYRSIINSIQVLPKRPGFLEKCESWRLAKHFEETSVYSDIHDGKIWQEFQTINGKPFLSLPYNFGLHLNMDWFQPFKHINHSEGVIYLSVLNLPRSERFLLKNIILLGVIPGPHEPEKHVNSYLAPLVEELLQLWNGVVMNDCNNVNVLVRAALMCCGCDIPAAKKCCGFVGSNALHGCSRCMVDFPTASFGESPDFSNMDTASWIPRTKNECREWGKQHRDANTKSEQKQIQRKYGIRYSVLIELPYFDPARMCIIDPMHNLFLGTAKYMLVIWRSSG